MSNNVLNGEKREICLFFSRRAGAATEIPVLGTIPVGAALVVFLAFGEILYAVLLCAAGYSVHWVRTPGNEWNWGGSEPGMNKKIRNVTMTEIADTPEPPYYAVIFTSHRTPGDNGYAKTADKMVELAAKQPGFLGMETAREGVGITVSYWTDLDSIRQWKQNARHLAAQRLGREKWYASFKIRIARVEQDSSFN